MGYDFDKYLVDLANFHAVWCEWFHSAPSLLKHPIKYLKWCFNEPNFDKWRKETNK